MPSRPISPSSSTSTTCSSPIPAPKRQLTMARKLRHLEDHEIPDLDVDSLKSPPREGRFQVNAAASSARSSVDINGGDINLVRLSTAVPHPLPLPDLAALLRVSDRNKEPNNAFRLPSPQEAREGDKGGAKGRERETRIDKPLEVAGSGQSSPRPQLFSGQSSPSSQITPRPELLPRKNQWIKGKLIGRGTFGSVYAATNRETGALCAMKEVELCPDDSKSIESMKQLQQEIKVLSHLKHPNIVQYYGSEIVDDTFYIYLEYVYPGSINKYVRELCGAITESVVRNFTRHILSGLAYLHGTKTIHRDIKGANLLVDAFGVVKLADFGMAKHLTGQVADLSLKGSPYWMAPELMQEVMERDNRSDLALAVDIWSLGCTVIEMLTGRPPWSEYEGAAAMFKVLRESPPIPETLSVEGKDFLCCWLQRNPAHRPSASKLLEHPFVRNSQQLDSPYHLPPSASSGSLVLDKT